MYPALLITRNGSQTRQYNYKYNSVSVAAMIHRPQRSLYPWLDGKQKIALRKSTAEIDAHS